MANPSVCMYGDRCTKARHRRSTCTLCIEHCPVHAVEPGETPHVDPNRCTGCGVCSAVCPTGAFEARGPSDVEMLKCAQGLAKGGAGVAFACALSYQAPGDESCIQVKCLGRLDESVLLASLALGASSVRLVTGGCATCPSAAHAAIERSVQSANALLRYLGQSSLISICEPLPAPARRERAEAGGNVSRRSFFGMMAGRTANFAAITAASVASPSGEQEAGAPVRRRTLRSAEVPAKRQFLLGALRRIGQMPRRAPTAVPPSLLWTQADVKESCDVCQMCAFFCPTGALATIEQGGAAGLSFKACDCTNCRLCADICYRDAVALSPPSSLEHILGGGPTTLILRDKESLARQTNAERWLKRMRLP